MITLSNGELEEINANPKPFIACTDFTEAKLYTEGVVLLSVLRKSDVTAKVMAEEEVAHFKHLVQESTDDEYTGNDTNNAWL